MPSYTAPHGPAAVPAAARMLVEGGPFPVAACEPFVFAPARFPEAEADERIAARVVEVFPGPR